MQQYDTLYMHEPDTFLNCTCNTDGKEPLSAIWHYISGMGVGVEGSAL